MNEYDLMSARELHALYWRALRPVGREASIRAMSDSLGRRHSAWLPSSTVSQRDWAAFCLNLAIRHNNSDRLLAHEYLRHFRKHRSKMEPLP